MIEFVDSITLQLSRKAKEEFRACEEGSYEDHIGRDVCAACEGYGDRYNKDCSLCGGSGRMYVRKPPYHEGSLHVVEILDRDLRRTRIRIDSNEEAETVFVALASGTFSLRHFRTAQFLYDDLSPYVSEKTKQCWPKSKLGY